VTEKFSNKVPWSLTKRWGIHTDCRVTNSGHLHLFFSLHSTSPRCMFSITLTSTAMLLLSSVKRRLKLSKRIPKWEYFQNLVRCVSQLLFLSSFGSACSLPAVYRYSVLNIKAEAKMKKNTISLITAIASKSWPALRSSSLPALQA